MRKNILQFLFSIQNENLHKVITILGLKIKFRKSIHKPELPAEDLTMQKDPLYQSFSWKMLAKDCLWKLIREYNFKTVLDLGAGEGLQSRIFQNNDKVVTAIVGDNTCDFSAENFKDIELIQQDYLKTRFNKKFDCIWASHILEHQLNIGLFLRKIHNDLKDDGILAITVPPCELVAGGGHLNIFTSGSLIYHLVSNGFDCSNMRLKIYDYNLSIICKKNPEFKFNDNNFSVDLKEFYNELPDYIIEGIERYKKEHPSSFGGHERIPADTVYKW